MSLKEPLHPAEQYVNLFLLGMFHVDPRSEIVQRSAQLPELQGHKPPAFARFRNRLKIMCDLDPVIYAAPREGSFEVSIDRQIEGQWYACYYTVRAVFSDATTDPSVKVSAEMTRKRPSVNPDLCL
jgi:hypothetical protein